MKNKKTVLVLGGDKRQRILAKLLCEDGYNVTDKDFLTEDTLSLMAENDIIIFPLPVSKDKVNIYSDNDRLKLNLFAAVKAVRSGSTVFGGGFSKEVKEYFEEEGIEYHDCLLSELFEFENAHLTVQGALKLLFDNTEEFLKDKKVLITGYGRISTALSSVLKKLNMNVCVAARNELQLRTAELSGHTSVNLSELKNLAGFDFIFNTVPHRIFDEAAVSSAEKKAVYFELASAPYGGDKELFKKCGVKYISASSLPGKYLPVSSAILLKKYMEQFV